MVSSDFSLLTDESTDEAEQLATFVRFNNPTTNLSTEQFICVHRLGSSKTLEAIMIELEEILEKNK